MKVAARQWRVSKGGDGISGVSYIFQSLNVNQLPSFQDGQA